MGVFKCAKHGIQSLAHVCAHIERAFDVDEPMAIELVFDETCTPALLCPACRSAVTSLLDECEQATGPIEQASQIECSACVSEWMSAHHLGDYLAIIWQGRFRLTGRRVARLAREPAFDCRAALLELSALGHGDEPVIAGSSAHELALRRVGWAAPVCVPCPAVERVLRDLADYVSSSPLADERHTDDLAVGDRVLTANGWFTLVRASMTPVVEFFVWRPPQTKGAGDVDAVLRRT